jgi:hypothetical protein
MLTIRSKVCCHFGNHLVYVSPKISTLPLRKTGENFFTIQNNGSLGAIWFDNAFRSGLNVAIRGNEGLGRAKKGYSNILSFTNILICLFVQEQEEQQNRSSGFVLLGQIRKVFTGFKQKFHRSRKRFRSLVFKLHKILCHPFVKVWFVQDSILQDMKKQQNYGTTKTTQ